MYSCLTDFFLFHFSESHLDENEDRFEDDFISIFSLAHAMSNNTALVNDVNIIYDIKQQCLSKRNVNKNLGGVKHLKRDMQRAKSQKYSKPTYVSK